MTFNRLNITVTITVEDRNAFAVLGRCRAAALDDVLFDVKIIAFI